MVTDISVKECLSEGWQLYKRHIGITLGALILLYLILILGGLIPILGVFFSLLLAPPLSFGIYYVLLKVSRDIHPRIEDVFFGFKRYGTMMGLYFLIVFVMMICLIPSFMYMLATDLPLPGPEASLHDLLTSGFFLVVCVNVFAVFFCFYRFWLVYFVIVDDPRLGVFDALKYSSRITRGNGHNIILIAIVSFAISICLLFALIIPLIVVGPFLGVGVARAYLKLKQMHEAPVVVPDTPAMM